MDTVSRNVNDKANVSKAEIDDFVKNGFKIVMEATKTSNQLPKQNNWKFYKAFDTFNTNMKSEGNRILSIMHQLMQSEGLQGNIARRDETEKLDLLIDANDTVLERVAINIDIMDGIRKKIDEPVLQAVSAHLPVSGSWNKVNDVKFSVSNSLKTTEENNESNGNSIRLLTAKNIVRPQMFFKDRIENGNNYLWKPRITEKPNSLKPLAIFLEETHRGEEFSHPYQYELDLFTPKEEFLRIESFNEPKSIESTPLIEVTTPEQLDSMLEDLRKHKLIAVDLEHHSYRTFMGITCLMQLSTSDKDYIIDTLTLRDKLWVLNEVFTKPTILKLFHGADSDIEWLQRDLSLYVVNMFDTHQAAKLLQYSSLSLASLLTRFCKIAANKHFQLADWRIRPLPAELKLYARQDTHYLIYIYNRMKTELYEKTNGSDSLVKTVFEKSNELCKKRYKKPVCNEESHLELYRRSRKKFDNRQLYALKHLYQWRDSIARDQDESYGYVLPNHMLFQISEILPREIQGVLACCNPIPPLVRANLIQIHEIILKARDQPLINPILQEQNRSRGSTQQFTKINIESPLYCPHDINKNNEFRDDLPTLLSTTVQQSKDVNNNHKIEKNAPIITIFDVKQENEIKLNCKSVKLKSLKFLGPYERYKLVKPFIEAEEVKRVEEEKKKKEEEKRNKQKESTERTDEERITDLKKHFFEVMKDAPEQVIPAESYKRKRTDRDETEDIITKARKVPKMHDANAGSSNANENFENKFKRAQLQLQEKVERRIDNIERFDYTKIDYGRFQGGASSVDRGVNVKTNFKAKNQNSRQRGGGKKNNKSFVYNPNVQRGGKRGKRGGRGFSNRR